jgi:hypothetical protein
MSNKAADAHSTTRTFRLHEVDTNEDVSAHVSKVLQGVKRGCFRRPKSAYSDENKSADEAAKDALRKLTK